MCFRSQHGLTFAAAGAFVSQQQVPGGAAARRAAISKAIFASEVNMGAPPISKPVAAIATSLCHSDFIASPHLPDASGMPVTHQRSG